MALADRERSGSALIRLSLLCKSLNRRRRNGVAGGGSSSLGSRGSEGVQGETENLCGAVDILRASFEPSPQRGAERFPERWRKQ